MSKYELTPEQKIRQRYVWFQEAQRLGNVKMTCLRLGISRKTFYKWKKRFNQAKGERSSLLNRSRRPHHLQYQVKKSLRRRYATRQDLKKAFARWLYHYNHNRLHMGLKGKTPIQSLQAFPQYSKLKQLRCHPC